MSTINNLPNQYVIVLQSIKVLKVFYIKVLISQWMEFLWWKIFNKKKTKFWWAQNTNPMFEIHRIFKIKILTRLFKLRIRNLKDMFRGRRSLKIMQFHTVRNSLAKILIWDKRTRCLLLKIKNIINYFQIQIKK